MRKLIWVATLWFIFKHCKRIKILCKFLFKCQSIPSAARAAHGNSRKFLLFLGQRTVGRKMDFCSGITRFRERTRKSLIKADVCQGPQRHTLFWLNRRQIRSSLNPNSNPGLAGTLSWATQPLPSHPELVSTHPEFRKTCTVTAVSRSQFIILNISTSE